MAANCSRRCHENRAQSGARGTNDCLQFAQTGFLQMVRELDDQNSVLRNEADESNQADLALNIQSREVQKREHQGARDRQRHGTGENNKRISKALELRGQHEINQDCRK